MKSKLLSYLLIPKAYLSFEISKSRLLHTDGKVYVINTCSRGIGHEFCRQLLHRSAESSKVIGLYRTKTRQLEELDNESNGKLQLVNMDIESQTSIDEAVIKISKLTKKVDLLINSAGILGDGKTVPGPERSISGIERSWLNKSFEINLIGHVMLSKALIHLMKPGKVDPSNLSKIVNISARVGSITDNSLGGWYSYRMSKAALNMFTKTLSVEVKRHGCVVLSLHPGTTDTDLSLPFQKNVVPGKLFPVEYSVNKMLDVIWNSGLDDTGKVFAYDGSEIPY